MTPPVLCYLIPQLGGKNVLPRELTTKEAAVLCGVTVPTIHRWIDSGKIADVRRYGPRTFRIPAEQIEGVMQGGAPLRVLRAAYDATDSIFGVAIGRGDIESVRELRRAMGGITYVWFSAQGTRPLDLSSVMLSLAIVAASSPLYYGALFKVVDALGEISCDKVLRSTS